MKTLSVTVSGAWLKIAPPNEGKAPNVFRTAGVSPVRFPVKVQPVISTGPVAPMDTAPPARSSQLFGSLPAGPS